MSGRLTILVPVYNERDAIAVFFAGMAPVVAEIRSRFSDLRLDFLFVDDGSTDDTVAQILQIADGLHDARVISLSRNFGKEAALSAGLAEAGADAVVIMDVDLQDPPELVPEMIRRWRNGARVVLARRSDRSEDATWKRLSAGWFYRIHNTVASVKIPVDVGDFRLIDRVVVDEINRLPENRRFMKGLFAWAGFPTETIDYRRRRRATGATKFSNWRLWKLAIEGITSFSEAPLMLSSYAGAVISLVALVYALFIVLRTLIYGVDVPGYASLLVSILFLGGIQLIGIGILGEYVGRIYSEVKRRPSYVVAERHGTSAEVRDHAEA